MSVHMCGHARAFTARKHNVLTLMKAQTEILTSSLAGCGSMDVLEEFAHMQKII